MGSCFQPPNTHGIAFVWATDGNYLNGTVVSIHSVLKNIAKPKDVSICLILMDVPDRTRERVHSWFERRWRGAKLETCVFSPEVKFKAQGHISQAAYARIHLAEFCGNWDRVIYLDCDTIATGDLTPLWDTDLAGAVSAAVCDRNASTLGADAGLSVVSECELDPLLPYVNSGVLLIDLNAWRDLNVRDRCIDALEKHQYQFRYHDQDALNLVLAGRWKVLCNEWNFVPSLSLGNSLSWLNRKVAQLFKLGPYRPMRGARILHFAGARKPWNASLLDPGVLQYKRLERGSKWLVSE